MRKPELYTKLVLLSMTALYFTACQPGDSKKSESESFSYSLSENGCETGKKTFSKIEDYCSSLIDDSANKGCAPTLRAQLFAEKCDGVKTHQNKSEASDEELQTPDEQTHSEPAPLKPITEAPTGDKPVVKTETPAQALPSEIVLTAHPTDQIRVDPKNEGQDMISSLQGTLKIDSIEPASDRSLKIGFAETITITNEMGRCELIEKSFKYSSADSSIGFALIGIDPTNKIDADACLTRLSSIAMTGFTVEFTNVPVGTMNPSVVPKVTLKVQMGN